MLGCGAFYGLFAQTDAQTGPYDAEKELFLDQAAPDAAAPEQRSDVEEMLRERERELSLGMNGTSGSRGFFAALQAVVVLAVVALAIYGIIFLIKRGQRRDFGPASQLKLLATLPLTPKTSVAVIAVGNKAWLAGITDSAVSLLGEITDQETIDLMVLERGTAAAPAQYGNFLGVLRRFMPSHTAATHQTENPSGTDDTRLQKTHDRLRGL